MPYKNKTDRRAAERRYRLRHRERVNAFIRVWKQANPEKVKKTQRRYRDRHPGLRRRMKLMEYGLTEQTYRDLTSSQEGKCAICRIALDGLSTKQVQIDHCHKTGAVRGVLCGPCNRGLGDFRDNVANLTAAIAYLLKARS